MRLHLLRHRLFRERSKLALKRPLATTASASSATQQGHEDTAFQQRILQWLEAIQAKAQLPSVVVGPSTIPGAGRGLLLAPGSGPQPKGSILTLCVRLAFHPCVV